MSILCRLGLHRWRTVWRRVNTPSGWLIIAGVPKHERGNCFIWRQTGHQCRRCRKRVTL